MTIALVYVQLCFHGEAFPVVGTCVIRDCSSNLCVGMRVVEMFDSTIGRGGEPHVNGRGPKIHLRKLPCCCTVKEQQKREEFRILLCKLY